MRYQLILAGLLAAATATAAAQPGAPGRVPTKTRNVMMFTELENQWMAAVQKHDSATLDKLVADKYELRTSAAPGVPTPRADSLKQAESLPPFSSSIDQMAVHEYGDVMVVSFMWTIDAPKDAGVAHNVFVVDTWKRNGDNWQVQVRYAAPADASGHVPGVTAPAPAPQKKI